MEIAELGGDAFDRLVALFGAGEPVTYRGMTLRLLPAELEVRVPAPAAGADPLTSGRALDLLTRARYRLGVLLASAPPLEASVGNRVPRLLLTAVVPDAPMDSATPAAADAPGLYELRGDYLRRVGGRTAAEGG